MKTFTIVDGAAYPGTLSRSRIPFRTPSYVVSYLSADLGGGKWMSIEIASEDESSAPSNDELREALSNAIRKKLNGRLVH